MHKKFFKRRHTVKGPLWCTSRASLGFHLSLSRHQPRWAWSLKDTFLSWSGLRRITLQWADHNEIMKIVVLTLKGNKIEQRRSAATFFLLQTLRLSPCLINTVSTHDSAQRFQTWSRHNQQCGRNTLCRYFPVQGCTGLPSLLQPRELCSPLAKNLPLSWTSGRCRRLVLQSEIRQHHRQERVSMDLCLVKTHTYTYIHIHTNVYTHTHTYM